MEGFGRREHPAGPLWREIMLSVAFALIGYGGSDRIGHRVEAGVARRELFHLRLAIVRQVRLVAEIRPLARRAPIGGKTVFHG